MNNLIKLHRAPGPIGMAAIGTAQDILGIGLEWAFGQQNAKRQVQASKQLMDYQQQKQLEMWEKTGYSAQRKQMEQAGLNPALLYGMGGGGGQTTGNASATAPMPHTPSAMGINTAETMIQAKLAEANIKVAESTANLQNTQATKIGGVDTKEAESRINLNTQEVTNKKAQVLLIQAEERVKHLDANFLEGTLDDRIKDIEYQVSKSLRMLQLADNEQKMMAETYNDRKTKIVNEGIRSTLENAMLVDQTGKIKVETEAIKQEVAQGWQKLSQEATRIQQEWGKMTQEQQNIAIKKFEAEIKSSYPTLWQIPGHIITGVEATLNKWFNQSTLPGGK